MEEPGNWGDGWKQLSGIAVHPEGKGVRHKVRTGTPHTCSQLPSYETISRKPLVLIMFVFSRITFLVAPSSIIK